MELSDVRPTKGRTKARKRKGRGVGTGQGKTAGRGANGQKQRFSIKRGFEGGQTPLYRRLPKPAATMTPLNLPTTDTALAMLGDPAQVEPADVVGPHYPLVLLLLRRGLSLRPPGSR